VVDVDLDKVCGENQANDYAANDLAPILGFDGFEEQFFPLLNLIIRHVNTVL